MAKTRKRSETDTAEAEPQQNAPESRGGPQDAAANGHAERVAARAYELYLARGGAHGQDWDDWLQAEREIIGNPSRDEER